MFFKNMLWSPLKTLIVIPAEAGISLISKDSRFRFSPELRAMIAYFGSPDGQSAEAEGELFADKIGKDVTKEIDAAILAAKYDGVPEKSLPKVQKK